MANTSRRVLDNNGNQFMPMNVEGGSWDEHFISTKKLVVIGAILFSLGGIIMFLADAKAGLRAYLFYLIIWAFISQLLLRYVVFEEKFYYQMYKKLSKYEITTPAMFFDLASINDTYDGAIMTYSDTKLGILVRLERDTITGKHPDFEEQHFDSISDFYRELTNYGYQFVQMNVMEQAGNDPRFDNLDKLITKSSNRNIRELMEKEIGYIKNITHNSLYESDYFLIYTDNLQRSDTIIDDVIDCIMHIMDGAYIGYRVLNSRELIDFIKEMYGVKYFNYTQAILEKHNINGVKVSQPFKISEIRYADGSTQMISFEEINKINSITSEVLTGAKKNSDISIQKALRKRNNYNKKIDYDSISQGFTGNAAQETRSFNKPKVSFNKPGKINIPNFIKPDQDDELDGNIGFTSGDEPFIMPNNITDGDDEVDF